MGIHGSNIAALAVVVVLAVVPGWAKTNYHSGIWNLLRDGGLCFAENGDSKAWPAGAIDFDGRHFEIWSYAWEETPRTKAGSTEHANHRILIFERVKKSLSYLGNYNILNVPFKVAGRTIKFDFLHGGFDGPHYPTNESISGITGLPARLSWTAS